VKISLNWLREFVDFELIEKEMLRDLIICEIKEITNHPDAEALKIVKIDIGEKELNQVVCAGTNLKIGAKAPFIKPGTILPNGIEVKAVKMRGIESNGMIAGADELRFKTDKHAKEIMILDTKMKAGTSFLEALGEGYSSKELQNLFTMHTAEIEGCEYKGKYLEGVVAGKMIEGEKIEGSDKLHKGIFDIGWKKVQIVYGSVYAMKVGDIIPVALPGASLPGGQIKVTEFQGIKSEGMLCGDNELSIENNTSEGITRFPANTLLGKPVAELLDMMQSVIEVDNKSLTHRPDLWGHYGFARELSVILNKKLKPFAPKVTFPKLGAEVDFKIEAKEMVRGSSFAIMENVKIEESPQFLKSKLMSVGIRPINNVVDITNYVMVELGQPMHAYDRKLTGDNLIIRPAKDGEILETIDHKQRKLSKEDIVMSNKKEPLLIIGIMGGANSEIQENTIEVIFEAGCWDPTLVRHASQRIGLRSESSQRFEKSLHPDTCPIAVARACELLLQICPQAKIAGPQTNLKLWDPGKIEIEVNPKKICSKIGVQIPEKKMIAILTALEFECSKTKDGLKVKVPCFRSTKDVGIEDDIVEEIARIYGYENIRPELPHFPILTPETNQERVKKHEARKILSGLGFNEVLNYSFYSENDLKNALLSEKDHLKVDNYLSLDQTHLRINLIPNLLKSVHQNQKNFAKFKIFEIGRTYLEIDNFMPLEEKKICALISNTEKNYKKEIFYELRGAVESFLNQFQVGKFQIRESLTPPKYAHPKKCAEIFIQGKILGFIYELNPIVKKNFDLEGKIGVFELNLNELVKIGKILSKYKSMPKFPGLNIDISVVIDKKKTVEEINKEIKKANNNLIQKIELFDIFEDEEKLGKDKKALAFKISLQAEDRTLTDAEMAEVQGRIFENLEGISGVIRGK